MLDHISQFYVKSTTNTILTQKQIGIFQIPNCSTNDLGANELFLSQIALWTSYHHKTKLFQFRIIIFFLFVNLC